MGEPALSWVFVELRDDQVYVDGVPVQGASAPERYRAALGQVARTMAAPRGTSVPVLVGTRTTVVNRVWVGADGSAEPYDPLPEVPAQRSSRGRLR